MKKRFLFCLSLLAIGLTASLSEAGNCRRIVKTVAVVKRVRVAQYVPLVVQVPTYSVSYNPLLAAGAYASQQIGYQGYQQQAYPQPQAFAPQGTPCDSAIAQIQAQINELRQVLIQGVQGGQLAPQAGPETSSGPTKPGTATPPPVPDPAQNAASVVGIFAKKCASCHDASVAATKGGPNKFVLTAGNQVAKLTPSQVNSVITQTYSQKMPKTGPKLTDEEFGLLIQWAASQK